MTYDPQRHHRRSVRLKGYDYTQPGSYFVTLCTQHRQCLFGEIWDDQMILNEIGQMVMRWWKELPHKFPSVATDAYALMPNHLHGIIILVGADLCVRPNRGVRPDSSIRFGEKGAHAGAPLPRIVQWFKTMTTNEYLRGIKERGWPPFPGRLWQRNYYEHIIRNELELNDVRRYIQENPARWTTDENNPAVCGIAVPCPMDKQRS